MFKQNFTLLLSLISFFLYSQESYYTSISPFSITPYDYAQKSKDSSITLEEGIKFKIIEAVSPIEYIISINDFKTKTIFKDKNSNNQNKNEKYCYEYKNDGKGQETIDTRKYFIATKQNLYSKAKAIKSSDPSKPEQSNKLIFDFIDFSWKDENNIPISSYWTRKKGDYIQLYVQNRNPLIYTLSFKLNKSNIEFPTISFEKEEIASKNNIVNLSELYKSIKLSQGIIKQHYISAENRAVLKIVHDITQQEFDSLVSNTKQNTASLMQFVNGIKKLYTVLLASGNTEFVESILLEEDFVDVELELKPVIENQN